VSDPKQLPLRRSTGPSQQTRQDEPGVVLLPQHATRIRPDGPRELRAMRRSTRGRVAGGLRVWTVAALRAGAVAALLALVPLPLAAVGGPDPAVVLDRDDARLRKLQGLLAELELYRGPVDGQPSTALSAALLQYQQAARLPLSNELTDALFDQLEASVRLRRLTRFLETLGREQSEQARLALLSQPQTRDLVAPPRAGAAPAPPPAGAVFDCLRAPTAPCLIDAAVEASHAIEEPRLRDWALSEIVKSQARAGATDAARATIRRIADARQIIVSLRDLATIQAERRDATAALATAQSIPDGLARIEAELAIAARQLDADARDSARASLDLADAAIDQVTEPLQRVALHARIASLRWRAGDQAGADRALTIAQEETRKLASADGRATGYGFVATSLAEIGRPAEAVRLITDKKIADDAPAALAAAAGAAARAHDPTEAARFAALIAEPRFRAVALVQLAGIDARESEPARAADRLAEAGRVARTIDEATWRDYPLSRIAQAYVDLKQPGPAADTTRAIADAGMRARLLFAIAHLQAAQGAPAARDTVAEAERSASVIAAPLDECWMLSEVALAFAAADDHDAARAMLRRAAEVAAAIQEPASRARAFSRVASVMLDL
jgi:hypothetical protein